MDRRVLDKHRLMAMPVTLLAYTCTEDTVRPEDAFNRDVSLAYLAQKNYQDARGYAELLINEQDRAELVRHIALTMPTEHKAYEQASKARDDARLKAAAEWRKKQVEKGVNP